MLHIRAESRSHDMSSARIDLELSCKENKNSRKTMPAPKS